MKSAVIAALAILILAGTAVAENLLVNGDFEQPLTEGWVEDVRSIAGNYVIERAENLGQPEPGFAARSYKYLAYHASLSQSVDVTDVDLVLTFDGKIMISGGSSTCWPAAAFIVSYIDGAESSLGRTLFLVQSEYSNWVESDSVHFIEPATPGAWDRFSLNISEELANHLPAVPAADVAKIKVDLFAYDNGT